MFLFFRLFLCFSLFFVRVGSPVSWLCHWYRSGCHQYVSFGVCISEMILFINCVPQNSILEPLRFTLFLLSWHHIVTSRTTSMPITLSCLSRWPVIRRVPQEAVWTSRPAPMLLSDVILKMFVGERQEGWQWSFLANASRYPVSINRLVLVIRIADSTLAYIDTVGILGVTWDSTSRSTGIIFQPWSVVPTFISDISECW